ncbi:MAG: hypothetical protein AAFY03_11915 [Pseudomonadota bacterium]
MTTPDPLQLHLFDADPNPAAIPPERRLRLLRLTGELLQEAAGSETAPEEVTNGTEIRDE